MALRENGESKPIGDDGGNKPTGNGEDDTGNGEDDPGPEKFIPSGTTGKGSPTETGGRRG